MAVGLFREGWWPGLPPTINPKRIMCSDCKFHRSAMAGWQWDRCENPKADLGSVVRNDQVPTCWSMRESADQCGPDAKWFERKT
jgi:hypothetical protein